MIFLTSSSLYPRAFNPRVRLGSVSYTHLTLPTNA